MTPVGYALSTEEHAPASLVRNARQAEEAGMDFYAREVLPWVSEQAEAGVR